MKPKLDFNQDELFIIKSILIIVISLLILATARLLFGYCAADRSTSEIPTCINDLIEKKYE